MTPDTFKQLDLEQRYEYLLEWGFFIGRRATPELNMALYSLNGFFAEMIMDSKSGQVENVVVYTKIDSSLQQLYRIAPDNPFVKASGHRSGAVM